MGYGRLQEPGADNEWCIAGIKKVLFFCDMLSATGHKIFSPPIRYMLLSSDRDAALRQS